MQRPFLIWWTIAVAISLVLTIAGMYDLYMLIFNAGLICTAICSMIAGLFLFGSISQGFSIGKTGCNSKHADWAADLSTLLGLGGTILGLILLFHSGDVESMKEQLIANMDVVLYTTFAGISSATFLTLQKVGCDEC